MKSPKAPKETEEQRTARIAEEERIRAMQARADSDEVASGRRLVTKKTRAVLRLFGARAGAALGGTNFVSGGGFAGAGGGGGFEGGGGGGGFPLGYSAGIQGFDMFTKQKLPKSGV